MHAHYFEIEYDYVPSVAVWERTRQNLLDTLEELTEDLVSS